MAKDKKIFISYSSKDNAFVKKLVEVMKELQLPYWKAPEMIPVGSNYAKEIPRAIQECHVCLFVVSKSSQESIWVEKEIDSVINYGKPILPIKIDDEPLSDMYKFYLNNVQMMFFDGSIPRLLEGLRARLSIGAQEEKTSEKKVDLNLEEEMKRQKEYIRRNNVFTENKAPVECKYCGGAVKSVSRGVYQCMLCGGENYDYFETVRRFLNVNGAATAFTIEQHTKVPRKVIDYFLKEEYLEIAMFDSSRLFCSVCKTPIRSGTLCNECKKRR